MVSSPVFWGAPSRLTRNPRPCPAAWRGASDTLARAASGEERRSWALAPAYLALVTLAAALAVALACTAAPSRRRARPCPARRPGGRPDQLPAAPRVEDRVLDTPIRLQTLRNTADAALFIASERSPSKASAWTGGGAQRRVYIPSLSTARRARRRGRRTAGPVQRRPAQDQRQDRQRQDAERAWRPGQCFLVRQDCWTAAR